MRTLLVSLLRWGRGRVLFIVVYRCNRFVFGIVAIISNTNGIDNFITFQVTAMGYNREPNKKSGKCLNGECVYTDIPRGCHSPSQKKEPKVSKQTFILVLRVP